jgi:cytochrome c oxidase assembly protein subunit 15
MLKLSTPALAWLAVVVNAIVILQGAVVRATGSGAGCGRHWPLCNGEVVPLAPSVETLIEFSHRLLSLAALLLGLWLLVRAWRFQRENPPLFTWAACAFFFLVVEALLGAATVLLGLTGDNATVGRGLMVATHLVNSLLLVGTLCAALVYALPNAPGPVRIRSQPLVTTVLAVGLVGMLVLMFSGGIAAMGNTIFPSESLAAGIAADFDPTSHLLIRLRILHPLIAISVGLYLFLSLGLSWWLKPVARAKRTAQTLLGVYAVQLLVGTLNLALLAPVTLQVLHLGLAVAAFALLSVFAVYTLGDTPEPRALQLHHLAAGRARLREPQSDGSLM